MVGRSCRYRWLIKPPSSHLGIASLAQVSKTGLCPLPEYCSGTKLMKRKNSGVYTHTQRHVLRARKPTPTQTYHNRASGRKHYKTEAHRKLETLGVECTGQSLPSGISGAHTAQPHETRLHRQSQKQLATRYYMNVT